jgi:hypothetical protein
MGSSDYERKDDGGMNEHNPVSGPLTIDWNGGMAPRLLGVDRPGHVREIALVTFYNGSDDPHVHDNARLLKAAWNSYDRHCGDRALDHSVADLLGQTLEALQRIADMRATGPHPSPEDGMASALAALDRARDVARAALARVKGSE